MKILIPINSDYIKKYFLITGIIVFCSFICFLNNSIQYDFFISLTSFVIVLISVLFIFKIDGKIYSLNKMFFLFFFFFFGLSPVLQYKHNINLWTHENLNVEDYLAGNILVIIILLLYIFFYNKFLKLKIGKPDKIHTAFNYKLSLHRKFLLIICSLSSFLIILYYFDFDLFSLLLRGYNDKESTTSLKLLLHFFIRPIPVICLLIFKLRKGDNFIIELILILIVIISNFPTGLPRLQIGALYIPLLFVYFKVLQKHFVFSLIFISAMLFIFPILNLFRAQYIDLLREKDIVFFQFNMLLEGHFDNYQNFIRMVKGGVVTGGRQLLGVIFFFIPRQIWPGKPEHSGIVIADNLNLSYSNISVNFFAEGYINFGFIGILLFIIIIAFLNARMDNFFWKKCNGILFNNPLFTCLYLVIFGMEFFILRGALLGAYPITLGLVTAVYITFFLSKGPFLRKTIVKLLIFFTGLKVSPNNNSNGY